MGGRGRLTGVGTQYFLYGHRREPIAGSLNIQTISLPFRNSCGSHQHTLRWACNFNQQMCCWSNLLGPFYYFCLIWKLFSFCFYSFRYVFSVISSVHFIFIRWVPVYFLGSFIYPLSVERENGQEACLCLSNEWVHTLPLTLSACLLVRHITKKWFFALEKFESLCYRTVPMIILKWDHISIECAAFETQLYSDLPWDVGQNDLGSKALKGKRKNWWNHCLTIEIQPLGCWRSWCWNVLPFHC